NSARCVLLWIVTRKQAKTPLIELRPYQPSDIDAVSDLMAPMQAQETRFSPEHLEPTAEWVDQYFSALMEIVADVPWVLSEDMGDKSSWGGECRGAGQNGSSWALESERLVQGRTKSAPARVKPGLRQPARASGTDH